MDIYIIFQTGSITYPVAQSHRRNEIEVLKIVEALYTIKSSWIYKRI